MQKKTKIVKEQVKPFKKGMCIDLKDQSDGMMNTSSLWPVFIHKIILYDEKC